MRKYASPILMTFTIMTCILGAQAQNGGEAFAADPLAQALQQDNVFVGNTLRSQVDANALRSLTQNAPPDRPLKIGVVGTLPQSGAQFSDRNGYTRALHNYLHLGRGTLLIRTDGGVSAATDALTDAQITPILQQNVNALRSDPVAGIQQAVAAIDAAVNANPAQFTNPPATPYTTQPQVSPDNGNSVPAPNNAATGQTLPVAVNPPPPPQQGSIRDYWWVPLAVIIGGGIFWFEKRKKKQNSGRVGQ